jgi:hypothetical protein
MNIPLISLEPFVDETERVPVTSNVFISPFLLFKIVCDIVNTSGTKHGTKKKKLRGFSPQANYTDRAIAAGQQS